MQPAQYKGCMQTVIAPIGVAATPTSGSSIACIHSSPTVRRGMGVKLPDMCCTNGACYDCFVPHPFKCKVLWADITFLEVEDCADWVRQVSLTILMKCIRSVIIAAVT